MKKEKGIESPIGLIAMAMAGGIDSAVDTLEKQGQNELINNMELPVIIRGDAEIGKEEEILTGWGIQLGEPIDRLFRKAILPVGWTKIRSDHPMYSYLLDEKGQRRATIMYKADFWDRDADIRLHCKYCPRSEYLFLGEPEYRSDYSKIRAFVQDSNEELIWSTGWLKASASPKDYFEERDEYRKLAEDWLLENYPDYKNLLAYW